MTDPVDSFEELNELLRERCLGYKEHTIRGRSKTVGEYFEIEKANLIPLPEKHMEPITQIIAKCNPFSTVRFETNRYSVPAKYVNKDITLKVGAFEITFWYKGKQIASHARAYEQNQVFYKLEHYLPILEKKPRAVWNAGPVKTIELPPLFWTFAKNLRTDYEIVKCLKLIPEFGITALLDGIQKSMDFGLYCYEGVHTYLAAGPKVPSASPIIDPIEIKQVDLSIYDTMLVEVNSLECDS